MKRLLMPLLLAAAPAWAGSGLTVSEGWIPEAPPGAGMLAGYAVIANPGAKARSVCEADSPDFGDVSIHRSLVVNGMSQMREVTNLKVPAKGAVTLEPGGLHLMLMEPRHSLKAGDRVTIRFHCAGKNVTSGAFVVKSAP